MAEVVSPGNKSNRHGLRAFVGKAVESLKGGIHLLIIDLFPPGPRDPQGIHKAIWDEFVEEDFTPPPERPLTLASYIAGQWPEAFVQPAAILRHQAILRLFSAGGFAAGGPGAAPGCR